jgi:hypothetical protein
MHSSNTCDMFEGFCIGCKNTAESFLFLFTVSLQPALYSPHRKAFIIIISLPPTPSSNKPHHTYGYVTCSKVKARSSQTSSDVTI